VRGPLERERRERSVRNARITGLVSASDQRVGYAENWVYSPPIAKLRALIAASRGSILDLRAEESHSGSNSRAAAEWRSTGGGALPRIDLAVASVDVIYAAYVSAEQGTRIRLSGDD
jgi:predicted dehydrogenase